MVRDQSAQFCTNRRRRDGCGATLRLYLAERLPKMHYSALALHEFVLALFSGIGIGIANAYPQATGALSSGHGWRGL